MPWPERRWMRHDRPSWIHENDPLFITFCASPRKLNQLAHPDVFAGVVKAAEFLKIHHESSPLCLLAMPDHVHLLVRIPRAYRIRAYIRRFKHAVSYDHDVRWQPGAFEHRIRSGGLMAKWDYILQNPVRAGLVSHREEWPYRKIWEEV
jgi:REP element-mobilizing transposase RayT